MSSNQELENAIFEINAEPSKWLEVALTLEDSAKILKENNDCEPQEIEYRFHEYMLWGFCIENLFKGILASKGIKEIIKSKKGTAEYSGPNHNLLNLAKEVGFNISIQEELLLKFLTNATLYLGRYPIPKNSSKLSAFWQDTYDKSIEGIIDRLKNQQFPIRARMP